MTRAMLVCSLLLATACTAEMLDDESAAGKADVIGEVAKSCGGEVLPGTDNTCAPDQYCHYELVDACGATDAPGVCAAKPEVCTANYAPVCGCDNQTYSNACSAAAAGASVQYDGECVSAELQFCGGLAGLACGAGEYCFYEETAICGAADHGGVCKAIPEVCTQQYAPVCGCDDQTYGNACEAASAGVSVIHAGECQQFCGGFGNLQCPSGLTCVDDPADLCDESSGGADCGGICVAN